MHWISKHKKRTLGRKHIKSRRFEDSELAHQSLLLRPVFAQSLNQIQHIMLNSEHLSWNISILVSIHPTIMCRVWRHGFRGLYFFFGEGKYEK